MKLKKPGEILQAAASALNAYTEAEEAWKENVTRSGLKMECGGGGCNRCCQQLVLGTAYSGVLIADRLLASRDFKTLDALIAQGVEQEALFNAHGETAADMWFNGGEGCALLQKDGRCAQYDVRPPACSSYYVGGGRETCEDARSKTKIPMIDNRDVLLVSLELDMAFMAFITTKWPRLLKPRPLGVHVANGVHLLVQEGEKRCSR